MPACIAWGPGLVGLMVACVMAANMSTCSNFMVNTGALFTKSVYVDVIRPAAGDREILMVGRVSGLLLTLLGVGFALSVENILNAFMFTRNDARIVGHHVHGRVSLEAGEPPGGRRLRSSRDLWSTTRQTT